MQTAFCMINEWVSGEEVASILKREDLFYLFVLEVVITIIVICSKNTHMRMHIFTHYTDVQLSLSVSKFNSRW